MSNAGLGVAKFFSGFCKITVVCNGKQYAEFFEIAGVDTVKELSHRVPENLLAKLEAVNAEKQLAKRVPALKEVRRYVAEAKLLKPVLEY